MPRNRQDIPREQRVSALLDIAVRLFMDRGVDAVTMADIARQAGVQSGALYWYFPSKDDVLAAVMDYANDARWERLNDLPRGMSAADRLIHYLADNKSMRKLHIAMHARMETSEVVAAAHTRAMQRLRVLVTAALADASADVDQDIAADALCAAFEGANLHAHTVHSGTEIVQFLLRCLLPKEMSSTA